MSEILLSNRSDLRKVLKSLPIKIGFDTETTGLGWDDYVIGYSFSDGVKCWYWDTELNGVPSELGDLLRNHELVMHNGMFDVKMLRKLGFDFDKINFVGDTLILYHLMNAEEKRTSLKDTMVRRGLVESAEKFGDIAKNMLWECDIKSWDRLVKRVSAMTHFNAVDSYLLEKVFTKRIRTRMQKGDKVGVIKHINTVLKDKAGDLYSEKVMGPAMEKDFELVAYYKRPNKYRFFHRWFCGVMGDKVVVDGFYDRFWKYGAKDAMYVVQLMENLILEFREKYDDDMRKLYYEDVALSKVVAEMEFGGYGFDQHFLLGQREGLVKDIELKEKAVRAVLGDINVGSSQQVAESLGKYLGRELTEGVAEDVLKRLGGDVCRDILDFRHMKKTLGTYVDGFISKVSSDGRMRTSFNLNKTPTFRFASGALERDVEGINIQNVPEELRSCIVADDGWYFLAGDYSGQEMRILTGLMENKGLIEKLNSGHDLHCLTASIMYDKDYELIKAEVDKKARGEEYDASIIQFRVNSKSIGFGLVYGLGLLGLADWLGIKYTEEDLQAALRAGDLKRSKKEGYLYKMGTMYFEGAQEWIDYHRRGAAKDPRAKFFGKIEGVDGFIRAAKQFYNRNGYVKDIYGRRRYIPLEFAGTRVVNSIIQGSAASMVRKIMLKLHDRIADSEYKDSVKMSIQMHDEIVFQVRDDIPPLEMAEFLSKIMEIELLGINFYTDWAYGKVWGELGDLEISRSYGGYTEKEIIYDEVDYPCVILYSREISERLFKELNYYFDDVGEYGVYFLNGDNIFEYKRILADRVGELSDFVYKSSGIKMRKFEEISKKNNKKG